MYVFVFKKSPKRPAVFPPLTWLNLYLIPIANDSEIKSQTITQINHGNRVFVKQWNYLWTEQQRRGASSDYENEKFFQKIEFFLHMGPFKVKLEATF